MLTLKCTLVVTVESYWSCLLRYRRKLALYLGRNEKDESKDKGDSIRTDYANEQSFSAKIAEEGNML